MKLKLNNNELVAILKAIECYLEYEDDIMIEASLSSFVNKVNDNCRDMNRMPEELAIDLMESFEDIKKLREDEIENDGK